jgi:formylglycine-generating enzyme required for sulfatase activity
MDLIYDSLQVAASHHWTWTEITTCLLFALTGLLLLLAYGLVRQDWAEISAWASIATVAVAIHFMLVGWREFSLRHKLDLPSRQVAGETTGKVAKDCPECPELIVVQPGLFVMGADDAMAGPEEGPLRRIMIADRFAISRRAITAAQYQAFVAATGYPANACQLGGADGPVQCVSWRDAKAYVAWLGKQTGKAFTLASAAQWEYAARAGAAPPAVGVPQVIKASLPAPATNATDANGFGVHGLGSSATEWVEDCWSPTLADVPSDARPLTPSLGWGCEARVVKSARATGDATGLRFSGRRPQEETVRSQGIGFRVVRRSPMPAKN